MQSAAISSTNTSGTPITDLPKPINKGGRPKGIHTPLKTKKVYNVERLADLAVAAVIEGKGRGIAKSHRLLPVSEIDRTHFARITGETVEVFNEHMANRYRTIADKAAQRIEEKLDSDQFKSGELGFILSVAHDKRLSLDGSRALNNASVNIQVNNFGPNPKDQLLTELDGMTNVSPNTHNLMTSSLPDGMVSPPTRQKVS